MGVKDKGFAAKPKNKNKIIKVVSVNVRSIYKRKDELTQFLFQRNIDIACIQEKWLKNNQNEPEIRSYVSIYNNRRTKIGGGVATIIKNDIKYKVIQNYTNNKGLEFNMVKIYNNNSERNLFICNVYLAPDAKTEQIDLLWELIKENIDKTLIVGDINAHHKKWSKGKKNPMGKHIYQKTLESGLKILQMKE